MVSCRKNAHAEAAQCTAAENEAEKLKKTAEQALNVTKDLVRHCSGMISPAYFSL